MNNSFDTITSLEKFPALVLNADYRPLSYYPLSLWSWQDSIKSVFLDRVSIHVFQLLVGAEIYSDIPKYLNSLLII